MLGPFGPYHNACWVLHRNQEAALIEMPPYRSQETPPWVVVDQFLKEHKMKLRYAFLSHAHRDHCESLLDFRRHFPQARFVAHRSVLDSHFVKRVEWSARGQAMKLFDETFRSLLWSGQIGGEPVHLIHAPKHSASDQLVLFRGGMCSGDWFLGDLKDCNALVAPSKKKRSIDQVVAAVRQLDYHVHTMYSAHGDCIYREVDFERMMAKSKIDHDQTRSA